MIRTEKKVLILIILILIFINLIPISTLRNPR